MSWYKLCLEMLRFITSSKDVKISIYSYQSKQSCLLKFIISKQAWMINEQFKGCFYTLMLVLRMFCGC